MQIRKNYFVKKRFQLNFLSRFVFLLLAESILIVALFMHISTDTLTTGYIDRTLMIEPTPSFFLVPFILITFIVMVGITMAAMVVFILLSHRIAGPLYRFEKSLAQIGGGDLTTRITLRKTDQLNELKEALNVFVGSLDERVGKIKTILEEARSLLSKRSDPQLMDKLESAINSLKDEIGHFKVSSNHKE